MCRLFGSKALRAGKGEGEETRGAKRRAREKTKDQQVRERERRGRAREMKSLLQLCSGSCKHIADAVTAAIAASLFVLFQQS